MKTTFAITLVSFLSVSLTAQNSDEMDLIQNIWGMEKATLIEEYMNLSDAEASAFWTVYESYEEERKTLGRKRMMIITDYVNNYLTLDDEKATELTNDAINNNIAYQKLAKKTFKKMSKALSPLTAAKFLQLENYLRNMILLTVQDELPFIGELDMLYQDR